jgi:hypothetical protein
MRLRLPLLVASLALLAASCGKPPPDAPSGLEPPDPDRARAKRAEELIVGKWHTREGGYWCELAFDADGHYTEVEEYDSGLRTGQVAEGGRYILRSGSHLELHPTTGGFPREVRIQRLSDRELVLQSPNLVLAAPARVRTFTRDGPATAPLLARRCRMPARRPPGPGRRIDPARRSRQDPVPVNPFRADRGTLP